MKIYWDVQQGTAEWYRLRAGIPTASEFDQVLTPKTEKLSTARHKYACRILAGRIMNWQADSLEKVNNIAAGRANEPIAVAQLEMIEGITTVPVGFVTTDDGRFGASPDRLCGIEHGQQPPTIPIVVEVKTPTVPKQFEYLLFGHEDAYRCQVQGQLYVGQADKALFYARNPRMPEYLIETGRDEPFIRKLAAALEQFSDELEELDERARSLGAYEAYPALMPPVDAELGPNLRRGPMPTEEELDYYISGPGFDKMAIGG